jgi:hypothetical protein
MKSIFICLGLVLLFGNFHQLKALGMGCATSPLLEVTVVAIGWV